MKTSNLIIAALIAGTIALAGCSQDPEPVDTTAEPAATGALETPPPMTPEPQTAADTVRVADVQLGTEVGADRTVAEPLTTFAADTETIFAAVTTSNDSAGETVGTLGASWTYQDGQLVDERTESVAFRGEDVTNFRISNPEAWPTGTYTLEITIDGEAVETREFTVE